MIAVGDDWSPECLAFAAHWRGLRQSGPVPTSETFLDRPAVQFAPHTYIVDVTDAGAMVRLHGTGLAERWGRDFTGMEIHDKRPEDFKARSLGNMRAVVSHPCGYLLRLTFTSSKGRALNSDLIQLPLAVKAGRPPRIVCFSIAEPSDEPLESISRYLETHHHAWLDIGAGTPAAAPQNL